MNKFGEIYSDSHFGDIDASSGWGGIYPSDAGGV